MEVLNDGKNRAFFLAVSSGSVKEAKSMLEKNPGFSKIQNGMLPILIALMRATENVSAFAPSDWT